MIQSACGGGGGCVTCAQRHQDENEQCPHEETIFALIASYSASVISLRIEHLLGILQPPDRIGCPAGPHGRGRTRADLDATRARAQLLELADAAFFAPGLILRLADPIHRLGLGFDAAP